MRAARSKAATGSEMTSLGVGGPFDNLFMPATFGDAVKTLDRAAREGRPAKILGGGTNLVIDDAGIAETVVCTRNLRGLRFLKGGLVRAEAGVRLIRLVLACARGGMAGLEGLAGIPGTVGGAVTMNAGAFGSNISDRIEWVEAAAPGAGAARIGREGLRFGYRRSSLSKTLVLAAVFRLDPGEKETLLAKVRQTVETRRRRHPHGLRSAGCFFRNVGAAQAGLLIDRAGLKGMRVGGAMVSPVHANFLVNVGRASSDDFMHLSRIVRDEVLKRTGFRLRMEVRFWKSAVQAPRRAVKTGSAALGAKGGLDS